MIAGRTIASAPNAIASSPQSGVDRVAARNWCGRTGHDCTKQQPDGRLPERGLSRFEVLALDRDRELIRSLARRLAQDDPEADRLRKALTNSIHGEPAKPGAILARLRQSPLVGQIST